MAELLAQVAEERGLDFEPTPDAVTAELPALLHTVENLMALLDDPQERRWLAAALAALSHHVQASTLAEPHESTDATPPAAGAAVGEVAVAVVTSSRGVLVGRRRDGIPRWVLPGGKIEDGETPQQAAARECAEETGLNVVAGRVIGRRTHPVTDQLITYVACEPSADTQETVTARNGLVEVCWLRLDQVEERMPDLYAPVRDHIDEDGSRHARP